MHQPAQQREADLVGHDDPLQLLNTPAADMPADERLILCGFVGDPGAPAADSRFRWRPQPWRPGDPMSLDPAGNGYVTISSFRSDPDDSWRRRRQHRIQAERDLQTPVAQELGCNPSYDG